MTIQEFLIEKSPTLGTTLYYPGAANDILFIIPLTENSSLDLFIFADYMYDPHMVPDRLGDQCTLLIKEEVLPENFGKHDWTYFWDENSESMRYGQPKDASGTRFVFETKKGRKFEVLYLKTDGIGTLQVLADANFSLDVIVVQDHGFGGNWSYFGVQEEEPSEMYHYLHQNSILPKHILCEYNGDFDPIWPGYERISETFVAVGSMHKNNRAFFKLIHQ